MTWRGGEIMRVIHARRVPGRDRSRSGDGTGPGSQRESSIRFVYPIGTFGQDLEGGEITPVIRARRFQGRDRSVSQAGIQYQVWLPDRNIRA